MDEQRIRELREQNEAMVTRARMRSLRAWTVSCEDLIALCDLALEALRNRAVVQAAEGVRASAQWLSGGVSIDRGAMVDLGNALNHRAALDAREVQP